MFFRKLETIDTKQLKITEEERELMNEYSPLDRKIKAYNYLLRRHGKDCAEEYAKIAKLSEKALLPKCDPWR